jgi:trehalose 6-phosphate synthase/phosphatase
MTDEDDTERPAEPERRLVVVSNRLPFNVKVSDGQFEFHESAGGLVTGLASYIQFRRRTGSLGDDLWVGWPGTSVDPSLREELKKKALTTYRSYPVFLSEDEMEQFYFGFCNATIWPLFHYFPSFTVYQQNFWEQYKHVNQIFCDSLMEVIGTEDVVWVHDYHLMLLPLLLKTRRPQVSVGFFLHIPFPSFEIFRLLPNEWRRDILEGLLGADLVGFHNYEYTHHFLQCVLRILGYEHQLAQILLSDRVAKVDTFPMGIDFEKFSTAPADPEVCEEVKTIRKTLSEVTGILSVDRLDYSKGILNRLEGYESFLEANPQYQGRVVLIMIVVPSRIGVREYELMKRQIEEMVGKINGRFGRVHWTPVLYQYRHVPFKSLAALYAASDVCLVTPLRDGMNLIAKEYVAARTDGAGVLILSEMAGSAKELPEGIIINPSNRCEIADALKEALETPLPERQRRNQIMQRRLKRYDVTRWADDFIRSLLELRETQSRIQAQLLGSADRQEIIERYRQSRRRALFLDYDGTLTPLSRYPTSVFPSETTIGILRLLAADTRNDIVVISGRDRQTMQALFGGLPVGLVAEHGVWYRPAEQSWQIVKPLSGEWKRQLLPILESYADRLPGALVEEKEHSVAWHYRLADPEQAGFLRAELTDHLLNLTAKADLQIFQGSKVVEVGHAGIDKGSAVVQWMERDRYDFVLAIGDDATDESLFRSLPEWAISIRVGVTGTHAQHSLRNVTEVTDLLRALAETSDRPG